METLDVFSVRDLRTRSGDLLRDAERGQLALITKHGRPAILAVPFDRRLLDQGVHRALALTLFENRQLTLAQAAKVAGLSLDGFIDLLGSFGLAAVDYPAEELADELDAALWGRFDRRITINRIVVADAGPLTALARIERLSLLFALYGSVVVPEAVLAELCVASARPGARVLSAALADGVIEPRALPPGCEADMASLGVLLDAGESAAILFAQATQCRFLLIDERRGRQIARRRRIPVVGLAGVLLAAKQQGLLESIGSVLAALSRQGYRLSDALVAEVLRLSGETGRQDEWFALREAVLSAHAAWLAERCRRHVGSAEVMGQALQCELGLTVSLRTVERACAPRVGRGSAGDGALWDSAGAAVTDRLRHAAGGDRWCVWAGLGPLFRMGVATLGDSRRCDVQPFDHERQSAWFEGKEGAFRHPLE